MRVKKIIALILSIGFMSLGFDSTITYARYLSYGYPSKLISFSISGADSTWTGFIQNAKSHWNSANTKIVFSIVSSSNNKVCVSNYADTWYGLNTATLNGSIITSFKLQANMRTIGNDATNYSNFATGVIVHELGHCIRLADNPDTTKSSIMKYSRDRNTMVKPQAYDESSVNAYYK